MSQQTHTITLKAVDGTTQVFQRIGQSATAAATQIQAAGQKAAQGLNAEAIAADKAAASTTKFGASAGGAARGISAIGAAARGAGFATFLGFLSNAANAAAEDEAAFARLEVAVGATGASYGDFANAIEKRIVASQRLGFSDDETADALANLTTLTQSATEAQNQLGLAQDIARGRNISLAAAASIVGKVASGNTAILSRYGIVIDENATGTQALAELQERFNGQAEAFSRTQGGAIARVQENLDNFVESIGGALGPMQTWLALLPGVTAGFQLAGGAASVMGRSLLGVAAAEEAVAVASGPATLGLAGIAAAAAPFVVGGAIILGLAALAKHISDSGDAASNTTKPIQDLTTAISELNKETALGQVSQALLADIGKIDSALADAEKRVEKINRERGGPGVGGDTSMGTISDASSAAGLQAIDQARAMTGALDDLAASREQVRRVEEAITRVYQSGAPDRLKYISDIREATTALNEGGSADTWVQTAEAAAASAEAAGNSLGALTPVVEETGRAALNAARDGDELTLSLQKIALTEPGIHAGLSAATSDIINFVDQYQQQINRLNATTAPSLASGAGFGATFRGDITPEDTRRAGQAIAEAHQLEADSAQIAIDKAHEHAAALADEAAAAVSTADALIGTADQRAQSVLRAAEAEEQYAERVSDINSNLSETLGNLQESYADQTADIAQRRVDIEEQAAERMQSLNEARVDAAVDAEEALVEVSKQRADVREQAAQQAQRAEAQWLQTAQDNAEAQATVRERLNETTAEAAQKFNDLNAQNLEQQRAIRVELQTTIADIQRQLHASQQEAQRDLQRLAQDHRTAMADFRLDASRIKEDLALVLADPRATAEQKNAAELAAQRQLQDLKRQERDEEESHDRAKEDIRRREREDIAQAARDEADAREQARADYQTLADERAAAEQAYHEQVTQANEQAATQLASLAEARSRALAQYQQQQADAHQQTADQLADLQSREQDILEQRAEKYADIEAQRQKLQQETADQQEALAKQAADAEQQFNASVADAQNAAAEQRIDAQKQYAEATKSDMTELQRLREEGLITEGEYQKIYNELIEVQETSKSIEDLKLISALKQIDAQQELLDLEKAKAKAAAEGRKEPDDPLDGPPPRRLLGGMARLGTLVGEAGSELAIKGSRMWEVGRSGPEILNLASGTLIMPHGGAQARMRGMALGGHATDSVPQITTSPASRRGQGSTINNYGTITIKVDNADVGSEIARQMAGQRR